jgi:hypothetical protein
MGMTWQVLGTLSEPQNDSSLKEEYEHEAQAAAACPQDLLRVLTR